MQRLLATASGRARFELARRVLMRALRRSASAAQERFNNLLTISTRTPTTTIVVGAMRNTSA
jgi:hypothetical protein